MTGFIEGECRSQATLFPERLDDYIAEESPVRVIDVFVDELDLARISHRPGYHSDFGEDVERKSDQAGWAV